MCSCVEFTVPQIRGEERLPDGRERSRNQEKMGFLERIQSGAYFPPRFVSFHLWHLVFVWRNDAAVSQWVELQWIMSVCDHSDGVTFPERRHGRSLCRYSSGDTPPQHSTLPHPPLTTLITFSRCPESVNQVIIQVGCSY